MLCAEVCFGMQLDKCTRAFLFFGGVPEWLKGTGCKPVGYAYPGSNPGAPTSNTPRGRHRYRSFRRIVPT